MAQVLLAYNNSKYKKSVTSRYFARSIGEDVDSNGGPATAKTWAEVDIDYPDENAWTYLWNISRIVYESRAEVKSEGYRGNYRLHAKAEDDNKPPLNGQWQNKVKKRVKAKDVVNVPYANRFYAVNKLSSVSASAGVDGERSHPAPTLYGAQAYANNFSFSETTEWYCYLSGDTSCHACN